MAITAATLTTTVSESITLNGQTFGNTVTKTHASVNEVLYKLNAGCSYIINGHEDSLMVEATSGTDLSGDNDATYAAGSAAIVSVKAQAFGSANVDVELLVASA